MDGDQGQRPLQSAMASVAAGEGAARIGDGSRRAQQHASDPAAGDADSEAVSAFDFRITYEKGSGFLRMLEAYLGEQPFRDGIRAYLLRHRYSNTTRADLWAALAEASGKPVATIAADWTTQPGFPVLEVDARCEGGRRRITLRQEQFRVGSDEPPGERLLERAGAARQRRCRRRRLHAPARPSAAVVLRRRCAAPLLVDAGNVGFFRVRYAPPLFDALASPNGRACPTARA